jgi:hypothetical protein
MRRIRVAALLAVLLVPGMVWAEDVVYLWDEMAKKEVDVRGTIDNESPAGIRIKTRTMGIKDIPAVDVRGVMYQSKILPPEFRPVRGKELRALAPETKPALRPQLLAEALQGYKDLDAQVKDEVKVHRYLQFKIAQLTALQARDDAGKGDPAAPLKAYKAEFGNGWEVVPCLRLLAQILEEKGDVEGATQAYADLSALPGLPRAQKQESDILGVRLLMRAGKYGDAERRLKELQKELAKNDPQRTYLEVCLVQSQLSQGNLETAEARLQALLKAAADPGLKALIHNLLGDYYRQKGALHEAFWHYLRVDVQYNQDREEQAKALFYLVQLFDKVKNDRVRADECLTRLKGEGFAGTTFQRQVKEEKK